MNHVALIIPTIDRIGGAERQLILLAKGLAKREWRVTVIALSGTGGSAAEDLHESGVEFRSLGMRKGLADPRGWIRLHRWLRRHRPDVVHAHLPHATLLSRWSRLAAPVRVLVDTIHTPATGPLLRRIGFSLSNWLSDHVTAVSQAVADAFLAARVVRKDHLSILPNGVDLESWKPDPAARSTMRSELSLTDKFLWFTAGRLDPVKDYPALLHAMAGITLPTRLVIAGRGPLEESLQRLSMQLGLNQRVQFLGFEPDVRRWMQAADAFVLSSRWEGLSMSLLEASACALPSVSTDVPGNREVVADGYTGIQAAAGSETELAAAMTRLMTIPPEERRNMGQRARQSVGERYAIANVLDRWESLYGELLMQNPKARRWAGWHLR